MQPGLQTRSTVHLTSDESLASHSVGWLQSAVSNEMQCQVSARQVLKDIEDCDQYLYGAFGTQFEDDALLQIYAGNCSVPQGSVLRPQEFTAYTEELVGLVDGFHLSHRTLMIRSC